ncbi:uncharacterized protein VTP21DRAFT_11676 [Calcarisporiella thermophila]|uniref:uncharacterized protein n=1 Tax=Calcarisporiella thermophila TaxID=911321 RepID=UPI00374466B3
MQRNTFNSLIVIFSITILAFLYLRSLSPRDSVSPPMHQTPILENGKHVVAGYYVSWAIYDRKYNVKDMDPTKLSHVLYGFANLNETGSVVLADPWADVEKHIDNEPWTATPNLYGNFRQLLLMKQKHRHVKVSLSIGGWSFSKNFAEVARDEQKRRQMVETSMRLVNDLGLDGIDIDWEFPNNSEDAENFVKLLHDFRTALTEDAERKGDSIPYLLTAAMPCSEDKYNLLKLEHMAHYVDHFYLMAYDYAGSWSARSGHQANLYGGEINTDKCVRDYIARGVPGRKIVLGLPMYGRSFENTAGPGSSYNGVGKGTWEPGSYDYKQLPLPGAQEHVDLEMVASYSYDPAKKEMVTYDNPEVAQIKAEYVRRMGLGGCMFWELSADNSSSGRSLLHTVYETLGGANSLDNSPNRLIYPDSTYENVRKNHI